MTSRANVVGCAKARRDQRVSLADAVAAAKTGLHPKTLFARWQDQQAKSIRLAIASGQDAVSRHRTPLLWTSGLIALVAAGFFLRRRRTPDA